MKELKERQKQQLRHKALKKGLDPEALTGKYPPKIQVASKYERRVDTRSYDDKKKLFEGVSILNRIIQLTSHTLFTLYYSLYKTSSKNTHCLLLPFAIN